VFIAIGAQIGKRIDIPARDAGKVIDAVTLLHDVETGTAARSLAAASSSTAAATPPFDSARTARRLGAEEALIVYRRDQAHMPAHVFEQDEALSEGIKTNGCRPSATSVKASLTVEVMQLDTEGKPQPTGQTETLKADSIVLGAWPAD